MHSDCRGPYHCGELEAHDGWRGVPGFGVTVSFITSWCLPNLNRRTPVLILLETVGWASGLDVCIDAEALAGGHDRPANPGELVGQGHGRHSLGGFLACRALIQSARAPLRLP